MYLACVMAKAITSYTKCDDSLYMFSSFRGSLRPRNLFDVGGDDCSGASLFYSASAFIGETHPKSIRSLRSQHFARSAPLNDFVSTGVPFLPLRYQKMYNDLSQMVLSSSREKPGDRTVLDSGSLDGGSLIAGEAPTSTSHSERSAGSECDRALPGCEAESKRCERSDRVLLKCRLRVAGTLFHGPECRPEKFPSPSSRPPMRDLFEERGTDSTEILNQVQDDETSVGIFRDDKAALASTLNSLLE